MTSTLQLKKSDYETEVGDFMGWGRGVDNGGRAWTDKETQRIQNSVASGLRRFYFCTPPHEWSFLRPTSDLTLASGAQTIDLPRDFGGLEGRIAVSSGSSLFAPIDYDNPGKVQQLYSQSPDATGRPMIAAVRPKKMLGDGRDQRFELFVFPEADAAYTFKVQYYVLPEMLTDLTYPYAYGGPEHAETILEACLWVAEERRDNISNGVHGQAFQRCLMASMAQDRRKKPQRLGLNIDRSDDEYEWIGQRGLGAGVVTINGVEYA